MTLTAEIWTPACTAPVSTATLVGGQAGRQHRQGERDLQAVVLLLQRRQGLVAAGLAAVLATAAPSMSKSSLLTS